MNTQQIKINGAVMALKEEINQRLTSFEYGIFKDTTDNSGHYFGLGQALTEAESVLAEVRELLEELNNLDPPHR